MAEGGEEPAVRLRPRRRCSGCEVHRLGGDAFQLSLSFHHAILDGWSVATLLAELFGRLRRPADRPPAPELAYRDFVALEAAIGRVGRDAAYWEDVVRDARPHAAAAPARRPQPRARHAGHPAPRVRRRAEAARLKALAARLGVPLKSVLLAAHLRVMGLVAGQADVLTGLVSNSRPEEAGRRAGAGPVPQHAPLAAEAGPEERWAELVKRVFAAEESGCPIAATRPAACSAAAPASRCTRRPSTTTTSTSTRAWPARATWRSARPACSSTRTSR